MPKTTICDEIKKITFKPLQDYIQKSNNMNIFRTWFYSFYFNFRFQFRAFKLL